MTDIKVVRRIRWDRIGFSIGAIALFIAEALTENYPALMWEGVASMLMVLLFREQDRSLNAMETAVKMAMVVQALTNDEGDNDGNTTA